MRFWRRKFRLGFFLLRRIPRFGWRQLFDGLRRRNAAYLAMDLADETPSAAAVIIDVGAHAGEFAAALDFLHRPKRMVLVEPNPARVDGLQRRFAGRSEISVVAEGLGDCEGTARFFVHSFDAASSLFSCRPGHLAGFGFSEERKEITVPVTTLATLMAAQGLETVDLLKLDCQGAELAVLRGAGSRLADVRWVLCEVSFETIYEGAPLFGEVHAFLRESGFVLAHLGDFAGRDSSIQWADALYRNDRPKA